MRTSVLKKAAVFMIPMMLFNFLGTSVGLAYETFDGEEPTEIVEPQNAGSEEQVPAEPQEAMSKQDKVTAEPEKDPVDNEADKTDPATDSPKTDPASDNTTEPAADTGTPSENADNPTDEPTEVSSEAPAATEESSAVTGEPEETPRKAPLRGASTIATAGVDAYAILYDDGELVFQKGNEPEEGRTAAEIWEVNPSEDIASDEYVGWHDNDDVQVITFKDKLEGVTSLREFFYSLDNLTAFNNLSYLDTSAVTAFNSVFYSLPLVTEIDLTGWDTSSGETFSNMITSCGSITSLDLSMLDISNASAISTLVLACSQLKTINCDGWDLRSVPSLSAASGIFQSMSLDSISMRNWTNVPDGSHIFGRGWGAAKSLDVTGWQFRSNATRMEGFFCSSAIQEIVGLDTWDVSNFTYMGAAFQGCGASDLSGITNWDTGNVTDTNNMFNDCSNLTSLDLSGWDTHSLATMSSMFYNNSNLTSLDLSNWDLRSLDPSRYPTGGALSIPSLKTLTCKNWSHVPGMNSMWFGRGMSLGGASLDYIDVTGWDLSGTTSIETLFANMNVKEIRGLGTWTNTSGITNVNQAFAYINSLSSLDLSGLDLSGVTDASQLFNTSSALVSIDLGSNDFANNTNFNGMFTECSKLQTLDLSNVDFLSATDTDGMFLGTTALKTITLPASYKLVGSGSELDAGLTDSWGNINTKVCYDAADLTKNFTSDMAGTYEKIIQTVNLHYSGGSSSAFVDAIYLSENTRFGDLPETVTRGTDEFLGWYNDDGSVKYTNSSRSFPSDLYAVYGHEPDVATAGVDAYAILYSDNTFVIQKGNTPDEQHGTVTSIWEIPVSGGFPAWYNYVSNVTKVEVKDRLVERTALTAFFANFNSCTVFENLDYIDLSKVTTVDRMFMNNRAVSSYEGTGIENWDISNVGNFEYLFNSNNLVTTMPDLSNWVFKANARVSNMLPSGLVSVGGLGNCDISNLTSLANMFSNLSSLTDINSLANWDVSNITSMQGIFQNCSSLVDLAPLSNWNTSRVTALNDAFNGCSSLTNLDGLANWDLSQVTTLRQAFYCNTSLTDISGLNNKNCTALTDMRSMFYQDAAIDSVFSGLNAPALTTMDYAFYQCTGLKQVNGMSDWNVPSLSSFDSCFSGDTALTSIEGLSGLSEAPFTELNNAFNGCSALTSLNGLEDWNVTGVGNNADSYFNRFGAIFAGCSSITDVDALADWDVSHNTLFRYMFDSCNNLADLSGLSGWDTSSAKSFNNMFFRDSAITDLSPIAHWNTASVTDMSEMFGGYNGDAVISELDFSNWDFSSVTNVNNMLSNVKDESVRIVKLPATFKSGNTGLTGSFIHVETGETAQIGTVMSSFTADRAGTYYKLEDLHFYAMGGVSSVATAKVSPLGFATLNELPTATRNGYRFLGWYTDPVAGELFTEYPTGEYLTALYAHWEADGTYTLILNPNRTGLEAVSVELAKDELYSLDPTIFGEVEGYSVVNWATRASGKGTVYRASQSVMNLCDDPGDTITLYAQWASNTTFTITAHYINAITGEELKTADYQMVSGGCFLDLDPSIGYYDEQVENYTTYFWSKRADIYSDAQTTYPAQYLSYYYGGEDSNEYQLIHMYNTKFYTDTTDIYAYCVPPLQARFWFANCAADVLPAEALTFELDGHTYGNGEYVDIQKFVVDSYDRHDTFSTSFSVRVGSKFQMYSPNNLLNNSSLFNNNQYISYCDYTMWATPDVLDSEGRIKSSGSDGSANYGNYWGYKEIYDDQGSYLGYEYEHDYRPWYGDSIDVYCVPNIRIFVNYQNDNEPYYHFDGIDANTYYSLYSSSGTLYDIHNFALPYISTPSAPEGKIFKGWFTEPVGGTELHEGDLVDLLELRIFYAQWDDDPTYDPDITPTPTPTPAGPFYPNGSDPKQFITITYDPQDGQVADGSVRRGEPITRVISLGSIPANLQAYSNQPNHYFDGWYSNPDGTGYKIPYVTYQGYGPKEDTTFYAHYIPENIVNFNLNGGDSFVRAAVGKGVSFNSNTGVASIPAGYSFGELPIAHRNYYSFDGWFTEPDGGEQYTGNVPVAENATYFAHWTALDTATTAGNVTLNASAYWTSNSSDFRYLNTSETGAAFVSFEIIGNNVTIPSQGVVIDFEYDNALVDSLDANFATYPNTTTSQPYFSKLDANRLTNNNAFTGSVGCRATVNFNGSSWSGVEDIDIRITVDTNLDGIYEIDETLTLQACGHYANSNDTTLEYGHGRVYRSFYTWQDAWGSKPSDADDYFYVVWQYDADFNRGSRDSKADLTTMPNEQGEFITYGYLSGSTPYYSVFSDSAPAGNSDYNNAYKGLILYRYPKTMIDEESGRCIVRNQARLYYNGVDMVINADPYTFRWDIQGRDEANFIMGVASSYNRVQETQESFLGGDTISLDWSVTTQNVNDWRSKTLEIDLNGDGNISDDEKTTTSWFLKKDITINQGPDDVFYNSGAPDDYYVTNPATGLVPLTEDDYSITQVRIARAYICKSESGIDADVAWTTREQVNRQVPYELWIRRAADSQLLLFKESTINTYTGGSPSETIELPEGTVEYEFRFSTSDYYWSFTLVPTIKLNLNNHTRALFNNDAIQNASSCVRMSADLTVNTTDPQDIDADLPVVNIDWHDGMSGTVLDDIYELTPTIRGDLTLATGLVSSDKNEDADNGGIVTNYFTIQGHNSSTEYNDKRAIDTGKFYVLLPAHVTFQRVYSFEGKNENCGVWSYIEDDLKYISPSHYTIEHIDNWEGTGRTMYIISFDCTGERFAYYNVGIETTRTYDDCTRYGSSGLVSWAFVNTTEPVNYVSYYNTSDTVPNAEKDLYTQELGIYNHKILGCTTLSFRTATTDVSTGLTSSILNNAGKSNPSGETLLFPGEDFSVDITYGQSVNDTTDHLVLKNKLDGNSTFNSIYVPTLAGKDDTGASASASGVVWYSVAENPDFDNIDTEHGWTQDAPVGETVYGIVIDYTTADNGRPFSYNGNKFFNVTLYGTAKDLPVDTTVLNQATLERRTFENDVLISESDPLTSNVSAKIAHPVITVGKYSNPSSGTVDNPATVEYEQDLVYTVYVANYNNNKDLYNIHLSDVLPEGLSYNRSDITLSDGTKLSESTNIESYDTSNGLDVVIKCLPAETSMSFKIPCMVNSKVDQLRIENTAYVLGYSNVVFDDNEKPSSETTYHIVSAPMPEPTGYSDGGAGIITIILVTAVLCIGVSLFRRKKPEEERS